MLAIHGNQAWLQPVRQVDVMWLPARLSNVMMLFAWRDQTIGLKGILAVGGGPEDLVVSVSDGVFLPPARSSRVRVCVPVLLTEIDGAGRAVGEPLEAQTYDVGPDGLALEPDERIAASAVMAVTLMLPEDEEPMRARALVSGRDDEGRRAAVFVGLAVPERLRLQSFVAGHLRWRLKLLRSAQEFEDDAA